MQRDYDAPYVNTVPSYGRLQHFSIGGRDRIAQLLATLPESVDNYERCRRVLDLFLISIMLDTSPGLHWTFKSAENGRIYRRVDGLAIAGLEMYKSVRGKRHIRRAIVPSRSQNRDRVFSRAILRIACKLTRMACET